MVLGNAGFINNFFNSTGPVTIIPWSSVEVFNIATNRVINLDQTVIVVEIINSLPFGPEITIHFLNKIISIIIEVFHQAAIGIFNGYSPPQEVINHLCNILFVINNFDNLIQWIILIPGDDLVVLIKLLGSYGISFDILVTVAHLTFWVGDSGFK